MNDCLIVDVCALCGDGNWHVRGVDAVMPYSVIGCCEIDKHRSGLLSRKDILDVLCQQGYLTYSLPPVFKS